MGGQTTNTTTQSSGLSNPAMNAAATTIGNQLNTQLSQGVRPYTESMVPGLSAQTQQGMSGLTNNPNNAAYGAGLSGAISQQADIAAGNVQNDLVRQRALDDALTASSSVFTGSGRFGSGSHATNLAEGAAGALAGLDYARQQQAMQNLPGLYSASMAPAGAALQAGQIQDAWNAANAEDRARIFDQVNNAGWNTLQRGASIFAGSAPISGTNQTNTQPATPWWQGVLSAGLGAL